jgi:glutamine synthetase
MPRNSQSPPSAVERTSSLAVGWAPKSAGMPSGPALPMRLGDALDALEADRELVDVLGGYFVSSFLASKRNEVERFERFVTDWEFREYAYRL